MSSGKELKAFTLVSILISVLTFAYVNTFQPSSSTNCLSSVSFTGLLIVKDGQGGKEVQLYKAKFVVDISDLGKDDPLMHNGTLHLSSLKVPWYTTTVSGRYGGGYFQKQIRLPYEKTLDLIGVDTGLLENAYISGQGCTSSVQQASLIYIGDLGSTNALASVNETSVFRRELEVEFLLHRVSSLEIVTYFVNSSGEVVHKSVLHQRSKAVM